MQNNMFVNAEQSDRHRSNHRQCRMSKRKRQKTSSFDLKSIRVKSEYIRPIHMLELIKNTFEFYILKHTFHFCVKLSYMMQVTRCS